MDRVTGSVYPLEGPAYIYTLTVKASLYTLGSVSIYPGVYNRTTYSTGPYYDELAGVMVICTYTPAGILLCLASKDFSYSPSSQNSTR